MTFKYDKENLFKEFDVAKQKDIKLSKLKDQDAKEDDIYKNRIQFFKEHIALKQKHPEYYEDLKINFDNLLATYLTTSPRDTFYMTVFGKTYAEKRAESIPTSVNE
tara:strand:+ start:1243 stop:1560 length:318 start_codon:yes stop_codon:yes gene_type:complete